MKIKNIFLLTTLILFFVSINKTLFYKYILDNNKNINFNKKEFDYRIKYYMGKWYDNKITINSKKNVINTNNEIKKKYDDDYTLLIYFFNKYNKYILFLNGDKQNLPNLKKFKYLKSCENFPYITKTRPINCKNNIISLLRLERHWKNVDKIKSLDIPFEKKKNVCIWRGTTTGSVDNKGNRFDLINKWFNKDKFIDVGFNFISQKQNNYKKFLKKNLNIKNYLKYKYLISVEGNDVASSLKWMLSSNSIVLMPKPTTVSWFMEDHLIPYVHYIPIKDDWSDLKDKYIWCENNKKKCLIIINNANSYVNKFINEFRTGYANKIMYKISEIYSQNIKFNF